MRKNLTQSFKSNKKSKYDVVDFFSVINPVPRELPCRVLVRLGAAAGFAA